MARTYEQIAAEAMQLSPEQRADLADKLLLSVDTPEAVTAAWDTEIERRVAQLEAGEVETISHEEAIARLRAKFG